MRNEYVFNRRVGRELYVQKVWCNPMVTEPCSPAVYYMDRLEKKLIQRLLKPMDGERLLNVGCGEGDYLRFFRENGCNVTGTNPSQHMLDTARGKLGQRADLYLGNSEDLPFSDNEFDIVTLILPDPACNFQNAINEAIRVCSGRIFLGTLNRYSPVSAYGAKKAALDPYGDSLPSSIPEMTRLIRSALSDTTMKWGSVIFFRRGGIRASLFSKKEFPP